MSTNDCRTCRHFSHPECHVPTDPTAEVLNWWEAIRHDADDVKPAEDNTVPCPLWEGGVTHA